jgi:hypothetical protein
MQRYGRLIGATEALSVGVENLSQSVHVALNIFSDRGGIYNKRNANANNSSSLGSISTNDNRSGN